MQRHNLELTWIIAILFESFRPLHDSFLRQFIHRAQTFGYLCTLAIGNVVYTDDHYADFACLCVALFKSRRESVSRLRRLQGAIAESVDLKHQLAAP